MAEEEKKTEKPEFVLTKKKAENPAPKNDGAGKSSAKTGSEKKKVVVVKKKTSPKNDSGEKSHEKVHPVVKNSGAPAAQTSVPPKNPAANSTAPQEAASKTENRPKQQKTFEINSARPNVKAGNLSDRPKNNYRGGYGNREGGYNNGGYNRQGGDRKSVV